MAETTIGFVGGGRVARILLAGWKRANLSLPKVVVSDADPGTRERLQAEFPSIMVTEENRVAAKQGLYCSACTRQRFPVS